MEARTIHLKEVLDITLKGKGTAGYTWKHTMVPEDIVTVQQNKQTAKPATPPRPGTSVDEIFTITGIKKGNVKIHFYLSRSWEPASVAAVEEKDIKITVE